MKKHLSAMLFAVVALLAFVSPASASMSPEMTVIAQADSLAPLPTFEPVAVVDVAAPAGVTDCRQACTVAGHYLVDPSPTVYSISTPLGGAAAGKVIAYSGPGDDGDDDPDIRT